MHAVHEPVSSGLCASLRCVALAVGAALVVAVGASSAQQSSSASLAGSDGFADEERRILKLLNSRLRRDPPSQLPFKSKVYNNAEFRWTVDEYALAGADRHALVVRYRYAINPERAGGTVLSYEAEVDLRHIARTENRRLDISLLIDPDSTMPLVLSVECDQGVSCYRERILRRCDGFGERCRQSWHSQQAPRGFVGYWPGEGEEGDTAPTGGLYWLQRLIDLSRERMPRASS